MGRTLAVALFVPSFPSAMYSSLLGSSSDSDSGGGRVLTGMGTGSWILVDRSSSARVVRISSSTSSRPSGPSQSPNRGALQISILPKESDYEIRESDVCMPVCPLWHFDPLPPIALRCSATAKKKKKGHRALKTKQRGLGGKILCTDSLPHKAHEGQRVYSAPVCTQGTERD